LNKLFIYRHFILFTLKRYDASAYTHTIKDPALKYQLDRKKEIEMDQMEHTVNQLQTLTALNQCHQWANFCRKNKKEMSAFEKKRGATND
jgi:hypothetical protein